MNPEIEQLKAQVAELTIKLDRFVKIDRYQFDKPVAHGHFATKLGFYGAAPVVQPNDTGEFAGFTQNAHSPAHDSSTYTGSTGSTGYTVGDIVRALKNLGLLAR